MYSASLRAFDEAVRAGSIRKASEALGVAPSSVSRHIALLEREMGTSLFERSAGGVCLTHAGELVARYARASLMDFDALRTDLDDLRGTQRRLLRLAVVESVAPYGPIGAIVHFRERYPAVSFNVRLAPAPRVIDLVREGQCDIGMTFCAQPDPDILVVGSIPEPIMLVVREDDPMAALAQVEVDDIAKLGLALPDLDFGIRQILDRAAAARGLRLDPILSSNVFETLRAFVRRGLGAAVLPLRAAGRPGGLASGLKAIPFKEPAFRDASIDLIVLRNRRLPRVVNEFLQALTNEVGQPD